MQRLHAIDIRNVPLKEAATEGIGSRGRQLSPSEASWLTWPTTAEWFLYTAISLCILDGAIRKWILRDLAGMLQYAPYFGKDVALIALVVFCKRSQFRSESAATLASFLKIGLFLSILGALVSVAVNLASLSLVGASLTFRSLVLLPLLSYLCIPRLRGVNLERLALLLGLFTILNASLGTLQYSSPIDDPINYYASKQYVAVAFEENVRAMGTFSYISGFGTMAMVGAWAGTTLLGYGTRKRRYFWLGIVIYAASLWSALLSISRAATIIVLGIFVVWLLSADRVLANFIRVGAAVAVLAFGLIVFDRFSIIQNASDVLVARNEAAGDTFEERVLFPITDIVEASAMAPFGVGLGSEQVAGVFIETGVMSFRQFEAQFPRIVMETGLIGMCGFALVFFGVLRALYQAKRLAPSEPLRRSTLSGLFLIGSLMFINVIFDHVASFFVWTFAAVLLAAADSELHAAVVNPDKVMTT
jgi:hypothetical protein